MLLNEEPLLETLGRNRFRVHLPPLDYRTLLDPARQAEVAMIISRTPGWVLLQTKTHYPPGIFRLPTGTVQPGEAPKAAMVRELHEEANLVPGKVRRLGRLEYVVPQGGREGFFTDLFFIQQPRGELKPNDLHEAITGWREARLVELPLLAQELRQLEAPWQGWGLFRSVLHQLTAQLLPGSGSDGDG